jgi:hypothetical protein
VTLAQFMNLGNHVVTANTTGSIRLKIEQQNTEYDTENFVDFIS